MVSVIIPTYNRASILEKSIRSVLDQTYTDLELIIVDDGSVDNTESIVKSINDKRIRYCYQENSGACAARNKGIDLAQGEYIAFNDSDDVWHPDKMSRQIQIMDETGADIVICQIRRCNDGDGNLVLPRLNSSGFLEYHDLMVGISTQTFFMKREVVEKVRFDNKAPRLQDLEWLLRAAKEYTIYGLKEVLVDVYFSADSITMSSKKLVEGIELIDKKNPRLEIEAPKVYAVLRRFASEQSTVKVSVIIPVFNSEAGIEKCLACLQAQTLKEIEMIFVDDRGNDNALSKVMLAAEKDTRIRIITNPQNIGSGPSRNRGIEEAKGEYLSFIDPVDYVQDNFLELLYKKAKSARADIVKGERKFVNEDGETVPDSSDITVSQRIKAGLTEGKRLCFIFTCEHTTAIYRRGLVLSSGARYGTSRYDQDTTFLLQICYAAHIIEFEDSAVYFSVQRENTLEREVAVDKVENAILAFREKMDFLSTRYANTAEYHRYVIQLIMMMLQMIAKARLYNEESELDCMQDNLRGYINSFDFADRLKEDFFVRAFLDYGSNLSIDPYEQQMGVTPHIEYVDVVRRWVAFVVEHPSYEPQLKNHIRYVFEKAINYEICEDDKERKKLLKEIRCLAKRLPDRRILTENYVAMGLFVRTGINLFRIRESKAGDAIKDVLRLFRKVSSFPKKHS